MIQELYNKLNNKDFQSPGGISYNFYIVPYDVRKEKEILSSIAYVVEDLKRPADYIDILSLDLFAVFMEYLAAEKFGAKSRLEHLLASDTTAETSYIHDSVMKSLSEKAHGRKFLDYVHAQVVAHFSKQDPTLKRPYVFLHGIGAMFPFLRANEFLTAFEAVNNPSRYKAILFYPGTMRDGQLSLFGILDDKHSYRAQILEI